MRQKAQHVGNQRMGALLAAPGASATREPNWETRWWRAMAFRAAMDPQAFGLQKPPLKGARAGWLRVLKHYPSADHDSHLRRIDAELINFGHTNVAKLYEIAAAGKAGKAVPGYNAGHRVGVADVNSGKRSPPPGGIYGLGNYRAELTRDNAKRGGGIEGPEKRERAAGIPPVQAHENTKKRFRKKKTKPRPIPVKADEKLGRRASDTPPGFVELRNKFGGKRALKVVQRLERSGQAAQAMNTTSAGTTAHVGPSSHLRVGSSAMKKFIANQEASRGATVSRPSPQRVVIGAVGGPLAIIQLLNWYASLENSELARLLSANRNELFRRMGGEAHQLLTHTFYLPPVGETLIQWFQRNITTWRAFHRFWNYEARGILRNTEQGWVLRVGRNKDGEAVDQPIDNEIGWLFSELDKQALFGSLEELDRGNALVQFKDSVEAGDRDVWRNEGRGLPMHLATLADGAVLPNDARFFVRGETVAWRGLSIGTFVIVEGADVETIRAMRGETGLIDPEDLEQSQ